MKKLVVFWFDKIIDKSIKKGIIIINIFAVTTIGGRDEKRKNIL